MIHIVIFAICFLQTPQQSGANDEVRIELLSLLSPQTLVVESVKTIQVTLGSNTNADRQIALHPGEKLMVAWNAGSLSVLLDGATVPFETTSSTIHIQRSIMRLIVPGHEDFSRRVETGIHIQPGKRFLKISARLPLEQAVAEITAAEMGGRAVPLEALKAQAICVRSYLLHFLAAQPQQVFSDTTAHRSWPYIASWCDLENKRERVITQTISAGFATFETSSPGTNLGDTLRLLAMGDSKSEQGLKSFEGRFRRFLTCSSAEEVCTLLPGIIRAGKSKAIPINFVKLYEDLLYWGEKVKIRWSKSFWLDNTKSKGEES